jgi:hypothetical protein
MALAAGVIAAVLAVGAGSSTTRATLRVTGNDPIHVRGTFFRAHVRVRVTISYSATRKFHIVRTNRLGTFNTAFAVPVALDPCTDTLVVTAIGPGASAQAKQLPRACPPPP